MTAENFEPALTRLLAHEGGYVNHPSDPGGPTKYGITLAEYRRNIDVSGTAADVQMLDRATAKTIYRRQYWDAMRCDRLPAGLDYAVFDYAVNSGTARATRVLCRLMTFPDSGNINDALLAAVRKRAAEDVVAQLCDERLAFLKSLKTWPVFGKGWSRRVADVRATALAMAGAKTLPESVPTPAAGKGSVPVSKTASKRAVAAGAVVIGVAVGAESIFANGKAWVFAAIVVGAAAVVVGLWWISRWRQRVEQEPS